MGLDNLKNRVLTITMGLVLSVIGSTKLYSQDTTGRDISKNSKLTTKQVDSVLTSNPKKSKIEVKVGDVVSDLSGINIENYSIEDLLSLSALLIEQIMEELTQQGKNNSDEYRKYKEKLNLFNIKIINIQGKDKELGEWINRMKEAQKLELIKLQRELYSLIN